MPRKNKMQSLEDYIEENKIEEENENEKDEEIIEEDDFADPQNKSKGSYKAKFIKDLTNNILNNCRGVSALGSTKIAQINKIFVTDLSNVFIETIVQMLLKNYTVYFDQFGIFRITNQKERTISSPLVNNGEPTIIPSMRLIRFKPSPILKKRIRGEISGKLKKDFGGTYQVDENGGFVYNTLKEEEKKDFIESEVWEDAD